MHKDDQMTPKERKENLRLGKPVDRMPISISITPLAERLSYDPSVLSKAHEVANVRLKAYAITGADGLEVFYGLNTFGIIFSAMMTEAKSRTDIPAIKAHPWKSLEEIEKLDPTSFTIGKEKNITIYKDAIDIIREKIGQEVSCSMGFPGALSAATSLLGIEKILRFTVKQPEKLLHFLDVINQALINMATEFIKDEIPVNIADPVASGVIISPQVYDKFVKPFALDFVNACNSIRPYGVPCHICGDTTKILSNMVESGYSSLSLDNMVNLKNAKEKVGDKVSLSGNVAPVDVMYLGTPDIVEKEVIKCFEDAGDSPKGFTIDTGCTCPAFTPMENIERYLKVAREYARKQRCQAARPGKA